jgi:hypothetical protein
MPRGFSDVVDWSALLIDLWRHLDGSCPSWVKMRKTQSEQMSSGLPLKADIAECSRHVAKVPKTVVGGPERNCWMLAFPKRTTCLVSRSACRSRNNRGCDDRQGQRVLRIGRTCWPSGPLGCAPMSPRPGALDCIHKRDNRRSRRNAAAEKRHQGAAQPVRPA